MTVYGKPLPTDGGSNDTWGDELDEVLESAQDHTERLQGSLVIDSPVDDQEEYLVFDARFPFDVKRASYQCLPSGTADISFKINGVNITGLNSLSVDDSKQSADASAANSVAIGNSVTVTPSSVTGTVERIVISLWGDRTAAGSEVV